MPAPGDQHRATTTNPFEDGPPVMSAYTAQEIATLTSRLEKQLGPEYISSRQGPSGQKVHYVAAEKCIALANDVFGFNGWSSSIRDIQVDFVDENATTGKISLGLSVIVRVTLKDGAYHEDIGYGHIENCKGKAAAFEKAKKEGTTDAMKRALRNFGNVLGNCVYDKDYLSKVTKMKVAPTKWDPDNLHRHSDFVPKKEPAESERPRPAPSGEDAEDEFGVADFDEADFSIAENAHPDEVSLELPNDRVQSPIKPSAPLAPASLANSRTGAMAHPAVGAPNLGGTRSTYSETGRPSNGAPTRAPIANAAAAATGGAAAVLSSIAKDLGDYRHDPNVGFCSSRAAEQLRDGDSSALAAAPFNPRTESTSLRRTSGIDHSTSKPLPRPQAGSPSAASSNTPTRGNFVNPHLDPNRRIGMPASSASPLQNRHTYRPPQMLKRPAEGGEAGGRAVLHDLPAQAVNASANVADDAKRIKLEGVGVAPTANASR